MSNPFKAIGKVFKAVVKVVKKVAIPALMIGAIVLTGGAAIGALPAIGSILGSIGISGTLASVLGGAISMGAIGAVTGGIGGALSGKGFMKGATGGFLMGAATGGVLGGLGVIGPNGLLGGASSAARVGQTAAQTGINISPTAGAQFAANAPSLMPMGTAAATSSIGQAATQAGASLAAGTGGGGLLGSVLGSGGIGPLIQGAGQIISGFASGKAAEAEIEARKEMERDDYDRIAYNYGYRNIYDKDASVPSRTEQWYQYSPVSYAQPSIPPGGLVSQAPQGLLQTQANPLINSPVQYQIVNGRVVPVGG